MNDIVKNQKVIIGLDGKERLLTFSESGRINYSNIKNGKTFGSSYELNTKDFPIILNDDSRYNYRKTLPKWITKEMIDNEIK